MNVEAPDAHLPIAYFSVAMMVISVFQLGFFVVFVLRHEKRTGTNIRIRPIYSRVNLIVFSIGISFIGYWATKAWIHFETAKDLSLYMNWTYSTLPLIRLSTQTIQYGFLIRSRDRSVEIIDSLCPDLMKTVQISLKIVVILTYLPVALSIFVACNFSLDAELSIRTVVRGFIIASLVGALVLDIIFLGSYIVFLERTTLVQSSKEMIDPVFLIVAKYGVVATSIFFISACCQFAFFVINYERWEIVNGFLMNLVFATTLTTKVALYWERVRKSKEAESKLERVLGCELTKIRNRHNRKALSSIDQNETVVSISDK